MTQTTDAAERSAHVTRGGSTTERSDVCFVCGGPWIKGKGGACSYAARCLPPLVEVCSPTCAEGLSGAFGPPGPRTKERRT